VGAIMMDEMDSAKTTFPHEGKCKSKNLDVGDQAKLRTHTIGALCNGFPVPAVMLVNDLGHYEADANVIVSSLHKILELQLTRIQEIKRENEAEDEKMSRMADIERSAYEAEKKKNGIKRKRAVWPRKLYLQLDSASVNKCNTLYSYLAFLVLSGVFESVRVGYMLVGHTHDIIDQVFSRISFYLRRHNVYTVQEFINKLPDMYHARQAEVEEEKEKEKEQSKDRGDKQTATVSENVKHTHTDQEDNESDDGVEASLSPSSLQRYSDLARNAGSRRLVSKKAREVIDERAHAELLEQVADWRHWLKPISEKQNNIRNYHQFRFDRGTHEGREAVMMRSRHVAHYDHANRASQWPNSSPIIFYDVVKAKTESGEFARNPILVQPSPQDFDHVRGTVQEFKKFTKMPAASEALWEDYFNMWTAVHTDKDACATCHELMPKLRQLKAKRPKRLRKGEEEDEEAKKVRRAADRAVAEVEKELDEHIMAEEHEEAASWWTNSILRQVETAEIEEVVPLGALTVGKKTYEMGKLQPPRLAPNQKGHVKGFNRNNKKNNIGVNFIVAMRVSADDEFSEMYPYYIGQVDDVHPETGRIDVFFWERHLNEKEQEVVEEEEEEEGEQKQKKKKKSRGKAAAAFVSAAVEGEMGEDGKRKPPRGWWKANKDGSPLTVKDKLKQMREWRWQEMHRVCIDNHFREIANDSNHLIAWRAADGQSTLKRCKNEKAMVKQQSAELKTVFPSLLSLSNALALSFTALSPLDPYCFACLILYVETGRRASQIQSSYCLSGKSWCTIH
jgi:hypothetical protein